MNERLFAVKVPSDPCYLTCVRGFVSSILAHHLAEEATRKIVLALDECCANIVKHRSGEIGDDSIRCEFSIAQDDDTGTPGAPLVRLGFRIRTFCRSAEIAEIKPRALDEIRPGGLGTYIVSEVMDDVRFESDPDHPGCMMLVLEKTITGDTEESPHDADHG